MTCISLSDVTKGEAFVTRVLTKPYSQEIAQGCCFQINTKL